MFFTLRVSPRLLLLPQNLCFRLHPKHILLLRFLLVRAFKRPPLVGRSDARIAVLVVVKGTSYDKLLKLDAPQELR